MRFVCLVTASNMGAQRITLKKEKGKQPSRCPGGRCWNLGTTSVRHGDTRDLSDVASYLLYSLIFGHLYKMRGIKSGVTLWKLCFLVSYIFSQGWLLFFFLPWFHFFFFFPDFSRHLGLQVLSVYTYTVSECNKNRDGDSDEDDAGHNCCCHNGCCFLAWVMAIPTGLAWLLADTY